tara:strand:+ start:612 stop:830 length:219 start_codon:yes stop_codon:yes gene_type:complete
MALWKTPKKTILINQIDVKYREIQNFEYQFQVLSKILEAFEIKDLQKILKATKKVQKIDEEEEKNNVAMGQQ